MNAKPSTHRVVRDALKADAKRYLEMVGGKFGMKPPTLAKKIAEQGVTVSASTLYRILNPDDPTTADFDTIRKIEIGTGIEFPYWHEGEDTAASAPRRGFAEPEATRVEDDFPAEIAPGPNEGVWRINSRMLELAGFLPGDLVLFEIGGVAETGDLVVAQLEDRTGGAETVIRIFEKPYLIARPLDPGLSARPALVDDEQVRIVGRFRRMLRERRPSA